MNRMKYIIIDDGFGLKPYIFGDIDQHSDVAHLLLRTQSSYVIGAGFVSYTPDGLQCWGRSESLDIDSDAERDNKIINRFFNKGLD